MYLKFKIKNMLIKNVYKNSEVSVQMYHQKCAGIKSYDSSLKKNISFLSVCLSEGDTIGCLSKNHSPSSPNLYEALV